MVVSGDDSDGSGYAASRPMRQGTAALGAQKGAAPSVGRAPPTTLVRSGPRAAPEA